MGRPATPIKVVLTASISLVASSALQGTTTSARASPEQWQAVHDCNVRNALFIVAAMDPGTYCPSGSPAHAGAMDNKERHDLRVQVRPSVRISPPRPPKIHIR